ncbi:serine/threonine-protein kinase [Rubripirellula reticaptiva]|uniref:Serine/threonine-protein kinase PknB n=1 Tax=Rubripirellula reticaptiva TaxID=2528013 RepID=A0A5C6F9C5_9BACT|nr:serine/threonine-protein kinase [Rubripirellula reticaptiva]TWU57995.1 Serine/threonine-protein kinase PknB [Rubripirellula reticaptiva]
MISIQDYHFDDQILIQLLDDSLPVGRTEQVELHLSSCTRCRQSLARLAASEPWWDETIEVLGKSVTIPGDDHPTAVETAMVVEWLLPILEPSESGIGMLDRYPVTEVIGQGGMGVVLRAYDNELNRPVAVKVLSPHLAGVGAARARFMREAQAAAAVVHPAIVPIYSVVTSARLPYLVMPLVTGGNLQQRIDREGPLDLIEVLRIAVQLADGLAAAHRMGVIHRDIKPANILVEEGGIRYLISDFGLARALNDASLTCSGMIAGTPQYMSPEQARGDVADAQSDLFSLGSLMYALATGRPPFRAGNPIAVLKMITESRPTPIHRVNERMPVWFDRLVGRLMAIQPSQRIATADQAGELLRAALAHVQNPSAHRLPVEVDWPAHRMRWIAIVAAALLIGTMIWAFRPEQVRESPTTTLHRRLVTVTPPTAEDVRWNNGQLDLSLRQLASEIEILETQLNFSAQTLGSKK